VIIFLQKCVAILIAMSPVSPATHKRGAFVFLTSPVFFTCRQRGRASAA
jgi:hypothetical protein